MDWNFCSFLIKKGEGVYYIRQQSVKMEPRSRMGGERLAGRAEEKVWRDFEDAKRGNLKSSHHKKKISCPCVWWWVLTRLTVVIILRYIQISNHYVVYLKVIYLSFLKKEEKNKTKKRQNLSWKKQWFGS